MGLPAAANDGKSRDTEALYREHHVAVAAFCRSLLRDRGEAEDATQQVFLSAHRALLNGSTPREPLAWLLTVARHECFARFRERSAAPTSTGDLAGDTAPDASVHVLRAGELATVWDEVGRMPPAQREAFLLREIRGLSYGQLAAELSLSPPSVRSLLLRARMRLRVRLRDVAAGLSGTPWVQSIVRLLAGSEGASPVPAATKVAAVGIGALVLGGGGALPRAMHHASGSHVRVEASHHFHARRSRASIPAVTPVAVREDRPARSTRRSEPERSRGREDRTSGESGSDRSGSREGTGAPVSSSGHGSDDTGAVAQPTTDGKDGGATTTNTSGRGSSGGSRDGGSSAPATGSDGGSGSSTTTTSSDSDGGGSSGGEGGGSGSSDG